MRTRIASSRNAPKILIVRLLRERSCLLVVKRALPLQRASILSGLAAFWRRAQTPSRLAVAPTLPLTPTWAGHTLMVACTPPRFVVQPDWFPSFRAPFWSSHGSL